MGQLPHRRRAGSLPGTRVEIVTKDDGKVIHTGRGANVENMARSIVDLRKFAGREIYIRIVDDETGGWGHVNFDDFVFHNAEPKFCGAAAQRVVAMTADDVKYAGLDPEAAAKAAILPDGFELKLFAAEPDIINPIAFSIDDRGRLWVVQSHTYPIRAKEGEGKDSIIVFEDTKGTGHFDKRTVFIEGLNLVSGIATGFGGVWVGAAPNLLFIPIADGDTPKPAGPPQVLLDGWGYQDTHETLNTLTWGPDGWLYGCHGVFTNSNVCKPGAPDSERTKINAPGSGASIPTRQIFEVFGEGTSNSWGIDFDTNGQLFAEACVIPHLFHIVQGGRFNRQAGEHFEKHTYADIPTIADHRHYVGNAGPHAGNGKSDSVGGGHAHAGLMMYQGNSWPSQYNGQIFMGNIHGQRINMDIPVPSGSGFIGKHGADFINFDDRWSQVVNFLPDPDGSVYFIDWYDKQQCHTTNVADVDETSGRIFKLIYKNQPATNFYLTNKSDDELAALVTSPNEFQSRHARRLLQERAAKNAHPFPRARKDRPRRQSARRPPRTLGVARHRPAQRAPHRRVPRAQGCTVSHRLGRPVRQRRQRRPRKKSAPNSRNSPPPPPRPSSASTSPPPASASRSISASRSSSPSSPTRRTPRTSTSRSWTGMPSNPSSAKTPPLARPCSAKPKSRCSRNTSPAAWPRPRGTVKRWPDAGLTSRQRRTQMPPDIAPAIPPRDGRTSAA